LFISWSCVGLKLHSYKSLNNRQRGSHLKIIIRVFILFVTYCYIHFLWPKVAKVCSRRLLHSSEVAGFNLYLETCNADRYLFVFFRLCTNMESLKLQYIFFSYSYPWVFRSSSSQGLRLQCGYKTYNMLRILRINYQILDTEIPSWRERTLKSIFRAILGQLLNVYVMNIHLQLWV